MSRASIPVDLFNPGQVFACMGFIESGEQLFGKARGVFDWQRSATPRFHLECNTETNPFHAVLQALDSATIVSLAPECSELSTEKWGITTLRLGGGNSFSIKPPTSPATLPACLVCQIKGQSRSILVDYWGDQTQRDNTKFWAGAGGYPGVGLLRDSLDLVRDDLKIAVDDPFAVARPQSSSFRFDWRRDYIPLDAGFSPNDQGNVVMIGYPIVEIMAAIGLSNARPMRSERTKLEYRYSVLGVIDTETLYDPIFLRAALGGSAMAFPHRDFCMQLGWPGQENQARCITNVIEETRGYVPC